MKLKWSPCAALLLGIVIFCGTAVPCLAQADRDRHEDPEHVPVLYDPVSLLRYCSETHALVIEKDAGAVEVREAKLPFVNMPDNVKDAIDGLHFYQKGLAKLAADVDAGIEYAEQLRLEFRGREVVPLAEDLYDQIVLGWSYQNQVEALVIEIGNASGAAAASEGSELAEAFAELRENVQISLEMLNRSSSVLGECVRIVLEMLGEGLEEQEESIQWLVGDSDLTGEEALAATDLVFHTDATGGFAGDAVGFEGRLHSEGGPLVGREVELLVDGEPFGSFVTDDDGRYEGAFVFPNDYEVLEIVLAALYRPRGDDENVFLAAKSEPVQLSVWAYQGTFALELPERAYPGLAMDVGGRFDYGDHPPVDSREIEVYLDDAMLESFKVETVFTVSVDVPEETELGEHRLTVCAPGAGRYAPVEAMGDVEVARATPVIGVSVHAVALVPGFVKVRGHVSSEVGPVKGGEVRVEFAGVEKTGTTSDDGRFEVKLSKGMGLEFIGSQTLYVQVLSDDAWHSSTHRSRSVFLVNWVTCGGMLLLVMGAAVVLYRRAKKAALVQGLPATSPHHEATEAASSVGLSSRADTGAGDGAGSRMIGWYRRVTAAVIELLGVGWLPSQTLREFMTEVGPRLGPLAGAFEALTRMVERVLYSASVPTDEEVREGESISKRLEGDLRNARPG